MNLIRSIHTGEFPCDLEVKKLKQLRGVLFGGGEGGWVERHLDVMLRGGGVENRWLRGTGEEDESGLYMNGTSLAL